MKIDGMDIDNNLVETLWNAAIKGKPVLLVGVPGSGKTMLARRLGCLGPFRTPHHTVSAGGLCGDRVKREWKQRCELALAHRGILFLDEIQEFRFSTLEKLRNALRDGDVKVPDPVQPDNLVPVKTWILGAANPCPCGFQGSGSRECTCTESMKDYYWDRMSWIVQTFGFQVVKIKSTMKQSTEGQGVRIEQDV